jgi:hypothetical protein
MAKEKMMRSAFIIAAIVLAACTVPPMEQQQETKPVPVSPTIEITAPRESETPKSKEHKPRPPKVTPAPPAAPVPPAPLVHPCAGIDTGDLKDTIKEKLDCLKEQVQG